MAMARSAFARRRRILVRRDDMPMISSTYYDRTLSVSAWTNYDAFLSFVAERREAPAAPAENA